MDNAKKNIIYASLATATAELITLPLCKIKTNYQNTANKSILQVTKNIYTQNGIMAFYRASPTLVLSQVFSTTSKYVLYRYLEDKKLPYTNKVINGISSGIISSFITHPIDVIKIHLQMNANVLPEIKKNGLFIFYRGYKQTLGKVIIGSSLYLPIYEYINEKINNSFISALITATISTIIIHPIDYFKTRQVYGLSLYQNDEQIINNKYLNNYPFLNNFFKYYHGLTINLLRIVPHFIITMKIIEYLKKY